MSTPLQVSSELKAVLLEILQNDRKEDINRVKRFQNHADALEPWKLSMAQGTFNGKPFSAYTVKYYHWYMVCFLEKYQELNYQNLESELNQMPVEMYGKRMKFHRAVICFGKYLVKANCLSAEFIDQANSIKPKRHFPATQRVLNEQQVNQLIEACKTDYERLTILMLTATGLRASEFCSLNVSDLNLEEGYLVVNMGKGGKRRRVGLTELLVDMLRKHLKQFRLEASELPLFLNRFNVRMDRNSLAIRVRNIAKRIKLHVSPHDLRRAFVTINANKGRSLVMLQMACGHADIATTRSYCRTTEDEVINAMKEWQ